ncbi:hypothetical protein ACGFX8_29400 [Streptomyces sp. NPDC048362]|uniref:hypothetical protein n=1 Tax=unclassified Streptomyces TaxID=2593676 RepID=UPI0033D8E162
MPAPSETFRLAFSTSAPGTDLVPVDPTRRPSHPSPDLSQAKAMHRIRPHRRGWAHRNG